MPIDVSSQKFGEPLAAKALYQWRINSARVSRTKTDKLRLNLGLVVATGPSKGQSIFWSPFQAMYWDFNASDEENINKVTALYMFFAGKLGIPVDELKANPLPADENEQTSILDFLINHGIEAEVKWQPAKGEYDGRWELGRIVRGLPPGSFVPAGWEPFVNGDDVEAEQY